MNLTEKEAIYMARLVRANEKEVNLHSPHHATISAIKNKTNNEIKSLGCGICHGKRYVTASNGFYEQCQFCKRLI